MTLIGERCLKEGDAYFKVKGIIHMISKNLLFSPFKYCQESKEHFFSRRQPYQTHEH